MSAFRRFRLFSCLALAFLVSASLLQAVSVSLNPATVPSAAPPLLQTVSVSGTGFPTGSITAASVNVMIACPPGNGGTVTVAASSVAPPVGSATRTIGFKIPSALTAAQPIIGCQVSVTDTGAGQQFDSGSTYSLLTVQPPASIFSISPGAGQRGNTVNVSITGFYTHFTAAPPVVTLSGAGVTVGAVNVVDQTHLNTTFTIDPAAAAGMRSVTVKTGTETASIANGFLVAVSPSLSVSVSPASGAQGQTLDVSVTGVNTNFIQGTSLASFGDGVKVNSVTVNSLTSATVNVSIDPIAALGARTFTITTGGEYGVLGNGFTVTTNNAQLTSILPTGAAQGSSATVTFTGTNTHWVQAGSVVSFGGGIVVGNVAVASPTSLTANITVPPNTPTGAYSAGVTTNGEIVTLPNAFTVTAATPYISNVNPVAGSQGQTLDVNVTGAFTSFTANTPTANFGANITVNSITVTDNTHLKINVTIGNTAFAGGRTASLTTNGSIFNFNFTVNSSAALLTSVSPGSGLQGASVALTVTGVNTHWVQGLTAASLDPIYITINRVVVNSATSAEVDITIAPNAPLGARTVTISTGGEIISLSNSFTVLPFTPTLSLAPGSGMIGTTVPVVFNGSFTHFAGGTTLANISGQGVSITGFTIDTPFSAHANFVIDPTAPTSPNVPCTPGNRTVTLTTVAGAIDEIVTAPFCVTSTPAVLTSISPYHTAVPVNNLVVSITGQYTHFTAAGPNPTQVGFGPNITVVGSPTIIDATHLSVAVNVAANAALGYRQVFVNTGTEQLTIGFHLDYPATSTLTSVFPNSGAQGQTPSQVTITGNLTNWGPTTLAILGAGITVTNLQVVSSNTATAFVAISPTTPVGGRSVTMITNGGAEVESGPLFTVTPSIASVSAIGVSVDCSPAALNNCPAPSNTLADINQGDTKSFRLVGVATNFVDGETILDFGPGISVTQVHVVDSTHLYGQITVSFSAATGFRSFRAITDGEIAPSFSNAVNVHPVTGTINITPTSAAQGTTLDITVNGVGATHFNAANTSVTFGSGPGSGMVGASSGLTTLSGADITVNSLTQMVLHVKVLGTAYTGLRDISVTTTNVAGAPANIEQIALPLAFSITQGAGIITSVTPNSDLQGHSVNLQVVGQNTSFQTGVTTAALTTGGCNPASPAGAVVTNVTASNATHATLAVAIDVAAATGIRGLCMYTLGESVGFLNAFNVLPGVPSLNGVGPVSALQGQSLTGVTVVGQFTHWVQGVTTITFGQGITTSNFTVVDATHATINLSIDPLAQLGSRNVVVTTGAEVVQGSFFSVQAGPAILSSISPSHANQGQHILMTITGNLTHWSQGLTQFSIGGGDITVNGFLIQSPTSALADLTLSPTAYLGTRTVTMSTAGEVVSLQDGFLVTGGIPSILSISPSVYKQGVTNVNVTITGAFTKWLGTPPGTNPATVFFGPNITVNSTTINSDTNITAVISVPNGAPIGVQNVIVQTGSQGLPGQVQIISNAPPVPYLSYEYPSVALRGQTLSVSLTGAYTNWLPGTTTATFGAGITINNFQVTGLNSAIANITIDGAAALGTRTVILTTNAEVETASFTVTVGTPVISLIDPPTAIQGQTRIVNLVGSYTTWSAAAPPTFNFGSGVTVDPLSVQIFGPTAARMTIVVDILASQGGRSVTATNGAEVAYNTSSFSVTASTATITSVTPNTVMQGTNGFVTSLIGFNTHWNGSTSFSFGGSDVGVTSVTVIDATHANVTLNLAPLAYPGLRTVHAVTGGEDAYLVNGFVVTPGTPILTSCVSCSSSAVIQQNTFHVSILGQFTAFDATTTVSLGNGLIINPGVGLNDNTKGTNVTGPQSIDVTGSVDPLAYTGCRSVTVTTGSQVLILYSAICIGSGPAAVTALNPNTGFQGTTQDVAITGTNTHFTQGVTVGNFGAGITLNILTVTDFTHATANISIAANANAQQNSITLTTQGEVATDPLAFTIQNNTPVVSFLNPTSGAQGATADISVTGTFTHWSLANTTADLGTGITATVTAIPDLTHATVHIVISPTAPVGNHAVRLITNLGGGSQEIASYTIGAGAGSPGYFVVTSGGATITSAVPTTPATVHQNDSGDIIAITGSGTHFTAATPSINFTCVGAPVAFVVVDDTHINATINVGTFATVGPCGVTVTTGGEVAAGSNLFNVLAGLPAITNVSPNSAHQNDTLNVTVTGLYTHFTSGTASIFAGNPNIAVNSTTVNNDTSITVNITVNAAAAMGTMDVVAHDTADGNITRTNGFTVLAGVPQITSVTPNTGPQGLTQNVQILGLFTHFSASSVVSISGTGVTIGNPPNAPDNLTLNVNFTVSTGAPAGLRNVTVTTGSEVVTLSNAFNVLPGTPNLSQLTPNIGVPNSTVNVSFTGVFTHFTNGATTANFGPGISVNGAAQGADGLITVSDQYHATATLTIDPAAALGARNVTVTTPAPPLASPETFTVTNGFTVQTTPSTPVVSFISPSAGLSGTTNATNVPINTNITVVFNEPMLASTITAANAFITDGTTQGGCWGTSGLPATVSLDLSGRVLTITPTSLLGAGRTFYLQLNSYYVPGGTPTINDASNTQSLGHYCQSFTTGFAQDATGPTFLTANIPNGSTGVPTNAHPTLGFDKPINPATMSAGLSASVAGTFSYSTDFTQVIFTPAAPFAAAANITITYTAALTDAVGHALTNPGTLSFTTGAGPDTTAPTVVTYTPINNSTTGTSPIFRFRMNKPINPLSVMPSTSSVYLYNNVTGAYTFGTITHSADFKTFEMHVTGALDASTQYRFSVCSMMDWAGNQIGCTYDYFYTGTGPDVTAPAVISVSPPAGATGVPVNAPVYVHFSKQLDPTTVPANAITLSGGVTGSIAFASGPDYTTLIFTPSANLSVSTTYTVNISGLEDMSGNPMTLFAGSSFTTSGSSAADTTHGTITITPSGSNVPVNTNVVFQLNKPVNPVSVTSQSLHVFDNSNGGKDVPGTLTISANLMTVTFVAAGQLPSNHSVCAYASYNAYLYDLAGNTFNSNTPCFTTSNAPDLTAPTVISVTPPNASTGIGPTNPVTVTFSKPMNPGTFTNNVAIYNGSTLYTAGYGLSADATTVSFSAANLPYGTTFTVVVNPAVTDLAGNSLAAQSRTSFTTAPQPAVARPSVNTLRPAAGATSVPATASITFFTSAAMNPATVNANSVHISQNGVLLNGVISFSANNQAITFAPAAQFQAGSLIQVWFTHAATDVSGNALYDYYASFTVAPDLSATPLTISSRNPCSYCTTNYNSVVDVLFTKPVNPATVTSASFFVRDSGNVNPINGSISFLDNNRLIRFKPNSPGFPQNAYYFVYLTGAIQDTTGLSFAGSSSSYNFYNYAGNPADNTQPFVTAMAPTNGSVDIGTNALVSVTFNKNVDSLTLDPANVTLTGPGGSIPLSISYNSGNFTMTITPQAPLPTSASVTLTLNGMSDISGNTLSPTPFTSTFTTAGAPDYNPPSVVLTSWANGQTNVPLTSSFSVTFNKPIDLRSVIQNNTVYLQDNTSGINVPATLSWSAGNTVLLITPTPASGLLNVNHSHRILITSLADLNGNVSSTLLNSYFTTVLTASGGGPQVSQFMPPDGFTGIANNFKPMIQFDRPLAANTLGGVTFVKTAGAVPVAMTPQLSAGGTILTLVPNAILAPNTSYTVTVAGVADAAGNPIAAPVTHSFTTGAGVDLVSPSVISVTPISGSTVGTSPLLKLTFNEPINPITATGFGIYQYGIGRYVNGVSLVWSANLQSVQFTYPGPLDPNDRYYFFLSNFCGFSGNCTSYGNPQFYTSSAVDNSPLAVTSVNPPNGATGVPVNPAIALRLNKPAAPTSVSNASVTVSGVAGTTVSLSTDGLTLTVTRPTILAANTAYTISVPAGAFTDANGNSVVAFSSSFTTSASGLSDTINGTISLTQPALNSLGNPLNQPVTMTFSKPYNPNSIGTDSVVICANNNCNNRYAGTLSFPDSNHITFTPAVGYPPSTTVGVFAGYFATIYDYAGNSFSYLYNANFTTSSVADTTPPVVQTQTPAAGATNVGPYATVALTFNKSLDQTTVNTGNFALYQGSTNLGASVSISSDRRTAYLSTTLPFSTTITVAVSTNVKDYSGNNMAAPYSTTFTTENQPLNFNPLVIQTRPGNGAPLNSKITIFTNSQINLSSAQNGLFVAQNGALIPGTVTLTADLHGIVWTPNSNYLAGATIEAFVTSSITDLNDDPMNATSFSFTTQAGCTAPAITAYQPAKYNTNLQLTNPVIEVQFCGPVNPATVTSTSFNVRANSSSPGSGTPIAGAISFANNNTLVRFKPAADLALNQYVAVQLTNAIQDMSANAFAGDGYYLYIQGTAVHDNTPPAVSSVTPVDTATGIGDNAPVRIIFNKLIDTLTVNANTVTLNGGAIPYTLSFTTTNSSTQTVAILTPLSPLPDSSTITVDVTTGVQDFTGAAIPDHTTTFQTAAGADFSAPAVIQQSIDNNNDSNVPVNTTFTVILNKPLDPATVVGNPAGNNTCCFFYYDSSCPSGKCYPPSTVNLSPDGRTVTIIPSSNLTPSVGNMRYYWGGATDLNGNTMSGGSQFFTSASGIDNTPPTVVQTNPVNGGTGDPTNTVIEVIFNKAVRATSLGGFTLDGAPITAVLSSNYTNDTVVKLVPPALLTPNHTYTVGVSGVQDVAGNTLASTYTFTFTTGPNFLVTGINLLPTSTVTTTGGTVPLPQNTNVPQVLVTNPVFTFNFDHGIDYASLLRGGIQLRDAGNNPVAVPLTYAFTGADQKTVMVTVNGTLTNGTVYKMWVWYNQSLLDLSGNSQTNSSLQFPFTTQ